MEQEAIERAMQLSHGNVQQAADLLGISRFALYRKLKN
jgi:transcriptional regulator of acetoin/glycerol metabolism